MYQISKDTMKSPGFCSIYRESFNIISSNRKLFTQLAIFLSLPFSTFTVIGIPLSSFLFPNIGQLSSSTAVASRWTVAAFLAFKFAYSVLSTGLSLLCFSSVTYSVGCIYTEHTDVTFKTSLCAFKKAWKKLVLTVLAEWVVIYSYSVVMGLLVRWAILSGRYQPVGSLTIIILTLVVMGGRIYISIIWIFGRTVANLDTTYGFKALTKSNSMIKGKVVYLIIRVFFPISSCSCMVAWILLKVVVDVSLINLGLVTRIGCGVAIMPLMAGLNVFSVLVLTVTYLVCKADKEERIMTSAVMDHLENFVDGYSPLLMAKDEQI